MAVTYADFVGRFPEFEPADTDMVTEVIAEATRRISSEEFEDATDDAVRYLAAHLLSTSPFGRQARMTAKDGSSTYEKELHKLQREILLPIGVI